LLATRHPGVPVQQRPDFVQAARSITSTLPGLAQLRVFGGVHEAMHELWVLAEFSAPVTVAMLAPMLGTIHGYGADVFNLYAPYQKGQ
jgi:hypothetical protein